MSLARKYQYEEIGEIREEPVTFQMMLLEPEDLVDAVNIAEHLRKGRCVLMNTETVSPELEQRLLDFLRGFAYTTGSSIVRTSSEIIFLAPYETGLTYEAENSLREG